MPWNVLPLVRSLGAALLIERLWRCRPMSFSSECPRSWLTATWGPLAPCLFALFFISWACVCVVWLTDRHRACIGGPPCCHLTELECSPQSQSCQGPGLALWGFLNVLNITKIEFYTERLKRKRGEGQGWRTTDEVWVNGLFSQWTFSEWGRILQKADSDRMCLLFLLFALLRGRRVRGYWWHPRGKCKNASSKRKTPTLASTSSFEEWRCLVGLFEPS